MGINWSRRATLMLSFSFIRNYRDITNPLTRNRFSTIFAKLSRPVVKSSFSLSLKSYICSNMAFCCGSTPTSSLYAADDFLWTAAINSKSSNLFFNLAYISSIFLLLNFLCFNSLYILSASSSSRYRNSSSIKYESNPAQLPCCISSSAISSKCSRTC